MISFKNYHIGLFVLFLIICSSRPSLSQNKCLLGNTEDTCAGTNTHCTIDNAGAPTGCSKDNTKPGCSLAAKDSKTLVCETGVAKTDGCCCEAGPTPCNTKEAFCKMDAIEDWNPKIIVPDCPPDTSASGPSCLNAYGEKDACATDKTHCIIDANGIPGGCAEKSHAACDGIQDGDYQCKAGVGCCCKETGKVCNNQFEVAKYCNNFLDKFTNDPNYLLNICPRQIHCHKDDGTVEACRIDQRYCVVGADGHPDGCADETHIACTDEAGVIDGSDSSIMCLHNYVDEGCCCKPDASGTICNTEAKWKAFCEQNGNNYLPICGKEYGAIPATGAILTVPRILLFVASLITVAIGSC